MKVLIIHPCARSDPRGFSAWSSDVAMYAASLKAGGHEPAVLSTRVYDESELRRAIDSTGAKLVLIHAISRQADQARAIGAFYATNYSGRTTVMFVGPHPSAWPADCMNVAKGVYALRGYAEHLLAPLADAIATTGDFFSLPGLSFPVMNRFYHNQIETPPPLDARPLPDRELTNYTAHVGDLSDSIGAEIDTSRGDYHVGDRSQACFDMTQPRTGVIVPFQQRTPAQVLTEAVHLKSLLPGLRFLGLRDEWCLANAVWVRELCSAWRATVGLPFWVSARPEFLTESTFEALAGGGCFRVHLMVESGSEHVRRNSLGRRVSNSHLYYVARACRRFGIALIAINELGFPGETEDLLLKSLATNRRMHPDWSLCSIFHPEPGSAIFQRAETKKWLTASSYGVFYDPDVRVDQPWIRATKIDNYLKSFNQFIYGEQSLAMTRR
ncbi:MAG: cobalamin B12-binding domain-containing protein [Planctomycetaceae bacterium]|nr:cobalamin B12-binding domain-containing protein [Planctomycetaceae bacterium]